MIQIIEGCVTIVLVVAIATVMWLCSIDRRGGY